MRNCCHQHLFQLIAQFYNQFKWADLSQCNEMATNFFNTVSQHHTSHWEALRSLSEGRVEGEEAVSLYTLIITDCKKEKEIAFGNFG